jgi:hypothetical protein
MNPMRAFVAVAALMVSSGCLVLSVGRFYDESEIVFDERLVGAWTDADDNVTATVERAEWRSYRIQYVHPTENGILTGYLFKRGDATYLDLTRVRGQDFGVFVIPGHVLVRVTFGQNEVSLTPLSYDWFFRALNARTLPAAFHGSRSERDHVVLGDDRAAFWQWLAKKKPNDPAFGPPSVFRR